MGIDLKEFGYRSRAAFLRDESPTLETFERMANHEAWSVQKSTLLHPKCPIEIRERFAKDKEWYKRFTAYFTNVAPKGFFKNAATDSHYYIQGVYKTWLKNGVDNQHIK